MLEVSISNGCRLIRLRNNLFRCRLVKRRCDGSRASLQCSSHVFELLTHPNDKTPNRDAARSLRQQRWIWAGPTCGRLSWLWMFKNPRPGNPQGPSTCWQRNGQLSLRLYASLRDVYCTSLKYQANRESLRAPERRRRDKKHGLELREKRFQRPGDLAHSWLDVRAR